MYEKPIAVSVIPICSPIDRERVVEYVLLVTYPHTKVRLDGFTSKEEAQKFYDEEYGKH